MSDDCPRPWRIEGEDHEGDGAACILIVDADGNSVAAANSWSMHDRGLPLRATERDRKIAEMIVSAINAPDERR